MPFRWDSAQFLKSCMFLIAHVDCSKTKLAIKSSLVFRVSGHFHKFCALISGCVASSLLCGLLQLRSPGFLMQWLLLVQSAGSGAAGASSCGSQALIAGSVVVAHGLSCSVARGIFPEQGLNQCPSHCKADSQPVDHQGRPEVPTSH